MATQLGYYSLSAILTGLPIRSVKCNLTSQGGFLDKQETLLRLAQSFSNDATNLCKYAAYVSFGV
jgi:hypothetical protein